MKELFERVSIRKFTDEPVEDEKIRAILRAAMAAIVSAYREGLWAQDYAQIDMSIAMENLWLACGGQGLGGVWLGIAPIEERMKAVEEIVGIPAGLHAFAVFPLGYPAESRVQQDRFDESRIHYI